MINPEVPEWKRIHDEATIIDVHAHPSLATSLFNRMLTGRFGVSRSFDPFSVRTDFTRLRDGCVDVLLSTIYAPERGIIEDCKILKLLRFVMPFKWKKVFGRSYFDVTNHPDLFYVRFHGRNSRGWRSGNLQKQFDYDYSDDELREWAAGPIPRMAARAAQGVIFFNNHVRGQAPRNAVQLIRLLGAAS